MVSHLAFTLIIPNLPMLRAFHGGPGGGEGGNCASDMRGQELGDPGLAGEASRAFQQLLQAGACCSEDGGAGAAEPLGPAAQPQLLASAHCEPHVPVLSWGHSESPQEPPGHPML